MTNIKTILLLIAVVFASAIEADAQDARLVGTWKWHFDGFNEERLPNYDEYIRIDIEEGKVYVRLKEIGKDGNGRPLNRRLEGENVISNNGGSISFDYYLSKNEYDNDDHLYWTVWYHYVVRYEGGRLNVSVKLMGEGRNRSGYLVKDEKDISTTKHRTYYNESDNW